MDWKTRIDALKTQFDVKDDGLAEMLGITPRTLLDLRKGLKDPTGPVQRLLEMLGSGQAPVASAASIVHAPLHLVLMHGDFELTDGRTKYDAILKMHSAVGRKTEYRYIFSPKPGPHLALILEALNARGISPYLLKEGDAGSRDCQFSAIAMWLVAQAARTGLASVTIAAPPDRFRSLAQTIRQYARVEVIIAHGHVAADEEKVLRELSAEGVMTVDVDARRFGRLVDGPPQRIFGARVGAAVEGAAPRSLEIDTIGNGQPTIPLEAWQIRSTSGTPEFDYSKFSPGDLVSYNVGISPTGAGGAIDVALLRSAASDSLFANLRVGLVRGMRRFTDDNSPDTLRCVREAIATCATQHGWAPFEYVWNRLYLLAKAGRGWDPGENGTGLVELAQHHQNEFELDGEGAVPARIKVKVPGLGM